MGLKDRIGIDLAGKIRIEDGIEWAGRNGVRFIDIRLDTDDNTFTRINATRAEGIRAACEKHAVKLGLHTLSAVNIAEVSPFVAEAADQYLQGYIDAYNKLGANWLVVHAGYHFTKDDMLAARDDLVASARAAGVAVD